MRVEYHKKLVGGREKDVPKLYPETEDSSIGARIIFDFSTSLTRADLSGLPSLRGDPWRRAHGMHL